MTTYPDLYALLKSDVSARSYFKTLPSYVQEQMETRADSKSDVVHNYGWLGLCALVAIPLPGTGAWTGALVAALMGLRLKQALPTIFLGVIIAGLIMTILTFGAAHLLG